MLFLAVLLQDEDIATPFGSLMEAMPHWAFIVIHSTLILVAFWLSRKTRNAGFAAALTAFCCLWWPSFPISPTTLT